MDNKKSGSQHFKEKVWRVVGGRIAQWQSIGLQFPWSLVRIRLCPFFSFEKKVENKYIRYMASQLSGKILASGASGPGSIPGEAPIVLQKKRKGVKARGRRGEAVKTRKRQTHVVVDRKALQLSGKIPAQGAGGAGSIPAKAPFFKRRV